MVHNTNKNSHWIVFSVVILNNDEETLFYLITNFKSLCQSSADCLFKVKDMEMCETSRASEEWYGHRTHTG